MKQSNMTLRSKVRGWGGGAVMLVKLRKYNNYLEKKEYKKHIKKENEYEYAMLISKNKRWNLIKS